MTARIQVTGHDDRFLPLLSSPLAVQMDGGSADSWRYDPASGTVFGRASPTPGARTGWPPPSPAPRRRCWPAATAARRTNPVQAAFTALPRRSTPG